MSFYIDHKNLHHAYALIGNADEIVKELRNFFKKELKFEMVGNPDFWQGSYDVMKIDDSHDLVNLHQNKPTAGDKKIFVVSANFMTEQAQNALLKIFEEPRGDTHFFLILPSSNNLIPTLASRLMIIHHAGRNNSLIDVKNFLKLSIARRIEEIKKLMESISDEERSKIEVVNFINALEVELKKKTDFLKLKKGEAKLFEQIEKVRQYSSEQSPSLKMLLEYLAFIIPNDGAILER